MEKFERLTAIAAPLPGANIDTDTIIRIDRLASVPRGELGPWALEPLRYRTDGTERLDFVLNHAPYRSARILVAGENFGCGSSREPAVWALQDFGIRAIIAPSFGTIFCENCFQNGIPAIELPRAEREALVAAIARDPNVTIDLVAERITANGFAAPIVIDPLRRRLLLEGLDSLAFALTYTQAIDAFEARNRVAKPWQAIG